MLNGQHSSFDSLQLSLFLPLMWFCYTVVVINRHFLQSLCPSKNNISTNLTADIFPDIKSDTVLALLQCAVNAENHFKVILKN